LNQRGYTYAFREAILKRLSLATAPGPIPATAAKAGTTRSSLVNKPQLDKVRAYLDSIAAMKKTPTGKGASYYMDAIDTKTASLLAHVSIMMAILALFYYKAEAGSYTGKAFAVELIFYLLVTLGCLRSIFIFGPNGQQLGMEEMLDVRAKEVDTRLRFYRTSLWTTVIVTAAFIITLIYHFS
jgi:hypothetical protein